MSEALQKVEAAIKQLMNGLHRQDLDKCVNIIVVSDHGEKYTDITGPIS